MKTLPVDPSTYAATQIERSRAKFECTCSVHPIDILRYRRCVAGQSLLCLGVRGGHEIDLFRLAFNEVIGVEINPDCQRPDVWVGSFDAMPDDWTGTFDIVFSNAFDHSQDPKRTAEEWKRVLVPGGFIVLAWSPDTEPTETDPTGCITAEDLYALFPGRVVMQGKTALGYRDLAIRLR